jgi:hypothetical protein
MVCSFNIQPGAESEYAGLSGFIMALDKKDKLLVFLNFFASGAKCCAIINGLVLNSTKKLLAEALKEAFPGVSVEYV